MLLKTEEETIKSIAREFGVKRMWLFGTSLHENTEAKDIDLAVEGIPPEKFFDF